MSDLPALPPPALPSGDLPEIMAATARRKRPRRRAGRPRLITPETTKLICDSLLTGCTYAAAAEANGVRRTTFYDYMKHGRQAIEKLEDGRRLTKAEQIFYDFAVAVLEAEAKAQRSLLLNIRKAATDSADWRAAAWMLQRRWPDEFADRQEISGPGGAPLPSGQVVLMLPDNRRGDSNLPTSPTPPPPPPPPALAVPDQRAVEQDFGVNSD